MKKKILSLALALAVCLGLTVSAFAAATATETFDGITITANPDGTLSYTGTGAFKGEYIDYGIELLAKARDWNWDLGGAFTVSFGSGITGVTDEYKNWLTEQIYGVFGATSVNFSSAPSTTPAQPELPATQSATAAPTNDKLEVDGAAADPTVYKIDGSNYFKIRDIAALLNGTSKQADVGYDSATNSVTLTTGEGYAKQSGDLAGAASGGSQTATPSNDAIYVNGQKIEAEVYKIGGSNYFKLRDLGKALNFYVGWSAERGMFIETDKPYAE